MYLNRDENFQKDNTLENFEKVVAEVKVLSETTKKIDKNRGDEIPDDIRAELDLPKNMGAKHQIDFETVRQKDCNTSRKTPYWSGQDVLMDSLSEEKSEWIAEFLNAVRVWPKGVLGILKKV